MILTHPIQAEHCKLLIGQPVCIVLHDGTEHIGWLSRVENGKLVLNETPSLAVAASKAGKRTGAKKDRGKASVSAFWYPPFPPYPYLGARLAVDLAAVALLFLLII